MGPLPTPLKKVASSICVILTNYNFHDDFPSEYLKVEDCNFIIVDWEAVQSGNGPNSFDIMKATGYHLA